MKKIIFTMKIKKKLMLSIIALLVGALGIALCLQWFDWKLLVVLFILMFADNLDNASQKL